jgi:N-acetylglucosaminyldiphosphoundecaprenol N-acetyl-beta-D-mannosaminyltransferase
VFTRHVVVNVAKIINMRIDKQLRNSILNSDIINIDGMGVVWGARFLGHKVPERVTGIDLFLELLSLSEKNRYPIFLLGARQSVLEDTAAEIKKRYPELSIAGFHHGYFWGEERAIISKINESGARLLFLAISSPMKENFIQCWSEHLNVDFVMGAGGAFDVVSGRVQRAPRWMQGIGLEWLYRTLQEPARMWKRYTVTNIHFLFLLLVEKIHFRLFYKSTS